MSLYPDDAYDAYDQPYADGLLADDVLLAGNGSYVDPLYAETGNGLLGYTSDPLMYDQDWSTYDDGLLGSDYLYDRMDYLDRDLPLYDAWSTSPSQWDIGQFELADLIHYQRHLENDFALSEAERLARWEERLRWEQLEEAERAARWHTMDPYSRERLGLHHGFWSSRLGGYDQDLSYLRSVPLSRGLFSSPYRSVFSRYGQIGRRFAPFLAPSRIRGIGSTRSFQRPIHVRPGGYIPSVPYGSRPLGANLGMGLRMNELQSRLRIAETRASLTSLPAEQRARALDDARRIRAEMNDEIRRTRELDRLEARDDAAYSASHQGAERAELARDIETERDMARLQAASMGVGQLGMGIGGGYSGISPRRRSGIYGSAPASNIGFF